MYGGYKNYETWAVATWISNDETSYNYWRRRSRESITTRQLGYLVRDELLEHGPILIGLWQDLLGAAIQSVNWHEIGSCIREEY